MKKVKKGEVLLVEGGGAVFAVEEGQTGRNSSAGRALD